MAGTFAENKDIASNIRIKKLMPALKNKKQVILDFRDVTGATQSFIHALISDVIRQYGSNVLDSISFKNCNLVIQEVITIVTEYMQET